MDDKTQRAIVRLSEALLLLATVRDQGDTTSVPIHIGPADSGHTVHVTSKTAEAIADAVDSMNAYLGSESVEDDKLSAAFQQAQPVIDELIRADEESVASRHAELMARLDGQSRESITSGEWSAAAVAQCNPDLYADITDLFLVIDPQDYLDDVFAGTDPHASMNAYEELVTGEWDGDL
ncbi:hypothetical protein [Streptomyces collinus]|uniref:hypothetical protein n=1 Tax=Streptomyces collinus TaxID=42684 RepID=UPI003820197C